MDINTKQEKEIQNVTNKIETQNYSSNTLLHF